MRGRGLLAMVVVGATSVACSDSSAGGGDDAVGRVAQLEPVAVEIDPTGGQRYLLVDGGDRALVVKKHTDGAEAHLVVDDRTVDAPKLPETFVPDSGRAVDGDFYLLGSTCPVNEPCRPTLLRSSHVRGEWTPVPLDERVTAESSTVDVGSIEGDLIIATGDPSPAFLTLRDDGSWRSTEPPAGGPPGAMAICSTGGVVYLWSAHPPSLSPGVVEGGDEVEVEEFGTQVWATTDGEGWQSVAAEGEWLTQTREEFLGGATRVTLCSGGSLLLPSDRDELARQVVWTDAGFEQTALRVPRLQEAMDQPFPPVALSGDGRQVVARDGVWAVDGLAGSIVLASSETDDAFSILVRRPRDTLEIHRVPVPDG